MGTMRKFWRLPLALLLGLATCGVSAAAPAKQSITAKSTRADVRSRRTASSALSKLGKKRARLAFSGSGRGGYSLVPLYPFERVAFLRQINPGFPHENGTTKNCLDCAIATDATLKTNVKWISFANRRFEAGYTGELEQHFGRAFTPPGTLAQIIDDMSAAGHGALGIVYARRNEEVGHFFNVLTEDGVARLFDGQSGRELPATEAEQTWNRFSLLRTN